MNLAATRQDLAAQLTDLMPDVTIHPVRPTVVRVGDGWLGLRQIQPSTFVTASVEFEVLLVLGATDDAAEAALDQWAIPLLDAISHIGGAGALTPLSLTLDGALLFAASASVVVDVTS